MNDRQRAEIEAIDAKRTANRDASGRVKNLSKDRKLQAEERALVVGFLGWEPELSDRYAATTGELIQLLG